LYKIWARLGLCAGDNISCGAHFILPAVNLTLNNFDRVVSVSPEARLSLVSLA